MGTIALLTVPKVEPSLPWFPTDAEVDRYGRGGLQEMQTLGEFMRQSDNRIREQVAVLVSVFGMKELATLCPDCALREIIQLCERPDVNAVLTAYQPGKTIAKRKVG